MERTFDGLCALVNKQGVCYQCSGLRGVIPEAERQGEAVPLSLPFVRRLEIVRECSVDAGQSQELHDLFWRRIAELERDGRGDVKPSADCAPGEKPGAS
jgi:RNA polymerase sigma-70 factor (ECF subfamily)